MTASQIIALLAARHAEDVFVPECKNGPTQTGTHARLDAWAMKKSWAHPMYFGYEVKVSRGDFLRDDKWPSYLGLCSQLFFVCPAGLIKPEECPGEVGLLWASERRLTTKKKADFRKIEAPEKLMRYVLMCRARIDQEAADTIEDKAEFFRKWLDDRKVDRSLGRKVGKALGQRIEQEVEVARAENERLARQIETLKAAADILAELKIPVDLPASYIKSTIRSRLECGWLGGVERAIERAQEDLNMGLRVLRENKNGTTEPG